MIWPFRWPTSKGSPGAAQARGPHRQGARSRSSAAMLERSHGPGIRYDVINSQVGRAFEQAVDGAKLRVAGAPGTQDRRRPDDTLAFTATFEVYPEVAVPDLSGLAVTRYETAVTDAEVQQTLDVLQARATFEAREGRASRRRPRHAGLRRHHRRRVRRRQGRRLSLRAGPGSHAARVRGSRPWPEGRRDQGLPLKFPDDYQGKGSRRQDRRVHHHRQGSG